MCHVHQTAAPGNRYPGTPFDIAQGADEYEGQAQHRRGPGPPWSDPVIPHGKQDHGDTEHRAECGQQAGEGAVERQAELAFALRAKRAGQASESGAQAASGAIRCGIPVPVRCTCAARRGRPRCRPALVQMHGSDVRRALWRGRCAPGPGPVRRAGPVAAP